MVIIAYRPIKEYMERHAAATVPLHSWYAMVDGADWRNISDLKNDFPSADYVGNERFIFNIGGNNFRLVAAVHFATRTVYVKFIGTHAAYDKIDASTINLY